MPELTVVVSDDTTGPSLSLFFFLASAVWVAVMVAAARDANILLTVCRVRHGADVATFGGALLVVGHSSSLPTDELEMYALMHCCGGSCISSTAWTLKLRSSSLRKGAKHQ